MINTVEITTRHERRDEVDFMRGIMVLGLILFHTARIFDFLPFYVKNDELSLTFTALTGFVSQWGMPLFFLIAGIAAWHSLARRKASEYVKERFRRLIIPLVFGIFVVVPPLQYYSFRTDPSYQVSFWQFYPDSFRGIFKLDFPFFLREPAHLWFLYFLFIYSMMALPLFIFLRRDAGRQLVSRLAAFCQRPGAILLLALPIIVIETFILTEESTGWNRYTYIPFLIYGYLFAADERFEKSLCKHRKIGLMIGTLTILAFFAVSVLNWQAGTDPSRGYGWQNILWRLFKSCSSWSWIIVISGWIYHYKQHQARRKQNDSPLIIGVRRSRGRAVWREDALNTPGILDRFHQYANEAVLPFYIIHQTVIVVIGFYIVRWETGILVKYLAICMVTFFITLILYVSILRRTNLTRFLFGMRLIRCG